MRDTSSLRPRPAPLAQPRFDGPARPSWPSPSGLWQDAGDTGARPNGVIEEGWAMSVDRLAGSGTAGADTEPGRRRRAERRRTGRRPGTDASTRGVAEPGQAGPESNVILLGQEAAPGTSATAEATQDSAAPTEAADTEAADTEAADTEAADTEAADTEAADTEAADTEAADTEAAASDASPP